MAGQQQSRGKRRSPSRPKRFRLLPFTLTMLALLLVLRLNDIYFNVQSIRRAHAEEPEHKEETAAAPEAHAEEGAKEEEGHEAAQEHAAPKEEVKEDSGHAAEDAKEAHGEEAAKEEDGHSEEAKDDGGHGGGHGAPKEPEEAKTAGAGKMTVKEAEALKAKSTAPLYTKEEMDLLQNLTKRRQELEQREQELEVKAEVLEATEKRISDKLTEMKTLESELSKIVAEYNNQQNSQLGSLVKIYENMKPSDAATIFNEMDMPILLEVIGKMSERKVAPVLAGMDPKKARDITQELAEIRRSQAAKKASATQVSSK